MQREIVNTETIASVGYDAKVHVLEVEFKDHSVFQIFGISVELYNFLCFGGMFNEEYFILHIFDTFLRSRVS